MSFPLKEKLDGDVAGIVWFMLGPGPPDRKFEMRCVADGMLESANKGAVIAAVISRKEVAYFIIEYGRGC